MRLSPQGDGVPHTVDSGSQEISLDVQRVFEAWNAHAGKSVSKPDDQGTVHEIAWRGHTKLSKEKVQAINSALKDYPIDDIVGAVDNFAVVLLGRQYFWSYPLTLNEFLSRRRGLHKGAEHQWWQFLPDNFDAQRYRRRGPEPEVVYEDPSVEEGLKIARKLDQQAAERERRAAV